MIANPQATTIVKTCNHHADPQACAHYFSAVYDRGFPARYTCSASNGRVEGTFTSDWTKQHTNRKWWAYTHSVNNNKGVVTAAECQADEFPPGYFFNAGDHRNTQLVRWIPRFDNSGAANKLWTKFCTNHDGDVGNGQRINAKKDQNTYDLTIPQYSLSLDMPLTFITDQQKRHMGSTRDWSVWKVCMSMKRRAKTERRPLLPSGIRRHSQGLSSVWLSTTIRKITRTARTTGIWKTMPGISIERTTAIDLGLTVTHLQLAQGHHPERPRIRPSDW